MEAQNDPRLLKGIEEFNRGMFFECHETLEEIWLEDNSEDRKFYQGIIQIAAGYFKLQQGVPTGAIKLWERGLEKIESYPPMHLGIHVEVFARAVRDNLNQLNSAQDADGGVVSIEPPTLQRVETGTP
jgi:predicted metal-dependent hydrolase